MRKILTAQINKEIYYSLPSRELFPEEEKAAAKYPGTQEKYSTLISTSSTRARQKNWLWPGFTIKRHTMWFHKAG